jgi:hypothetical protein
VKAWMKDIREFMEVELNYQFKHVDGGEKKILKRARKILTSLNRNDRSAVQLFLCKQWLDKMYELHDVMKEAVKREII